MSKQTRNSPGDRTPDAAHLLTRDPLAGESKTEGRGADAILRDLPSASGGIGTAAAASGIGTPAGSAVGGEATRELAGSGGGPRTGIGPTGVGAARATRIARAPVGDDAEIATRAGEAGTALEDLNAGMPAEEQGREP